MLAKDTQALPLSLFALIERYCQLVKQETGSPPSVPYDAEWLSPAQLDHGSAEVAYWHPVAQQPPAKFDEVETAIGISLPAAGVGYWSSCFSGNIGVRFGGLEFELLLPWNHDDIERFKENLIGHLLLQQRRKIAPTMFIGCGVQDERILSLDAQQQVVWEWPGKRKQIVLAADLEQFLCQCEVFSLSE